jgi:6-phosphogluconolactonase
MKFLKIVSILIGVLLMMTSCRNEQKNTIEMKIIDLEVLVGTYTSDKSKGIYKLKLDPNTGEVKSNNLVVKVQNPSFLTLSKDKKTVYAVQENEEGKVSSYKWNATKDSLVAISNFATEGKHPCYVSLNSNESLIAVGNYSSGNLALYNVEENNLLEKSIQIKQHKGIGVFLPRQEGPHVHCTIFYKNKFLYVVDLGTDKILYYPIDNGVLGDQKIALKTDDSDGPRHLVFHPIKEISYVINEFSNTIIVSKINKETGIFDRIQKINTLPEGFIGESFSAGIKLSNDGRFLYASNRGHNSIATFAIAKDGTLTLINHITSGGIWPRDFTLSPDNKFLIVANQFDNNVVVFKRNEELGTLINTGNKIEISLPVFVKFL